MSKKFHLEIQLTKDGWHTIDTYNRHSDALDYVRTKMGNGKYPIRIVRVERTIVFEDKRK